MEFLKCLILKVQSMRRYFEIVELIISWNISMPDRVESIRHILFMNKKYIFN